MGFLWWSSHCSVENFVKCLLSRLPSILPWWSLFLYEFGGDDTNQSLLWHEEASRLTNEDQLLCLWRLDQDHIIIRSGFYRTELKRIWHFSNLPISMSPDMWKIVLWQFWVVLKVYIEKWRLDETKEGFFNARY